MHQLGCGRVKQGESAMGRCPVEPHLALDAFPDGRRCLRGNAEF
jgi:hypothetical protein